MEASLLIVGCHFDNIRRLDTQRFTITISKAVDTRNELLDLQNLDILILKDDLPIQHAYPTAPVTTGSGSNGPGVYL